MKTEITTMHSNGTPPEQNGQRRRALFKTAGIISGIAIAMSLTSCLLGPYDAYGQGHGTVYRSGHRINALPSGYRSESLAGNTYYYHNGYYYRQGSGGYVIVDAPRGSRYYDDYRNRQNMRQTNRHDHDGYGRHDTNFRQTEVIRSLPRGHRVVNHRGVTYYQYGDRFYRSQGDGYVTVNRPY